jgi:hypothetical protein
MLVRVSARVLLAMMLALTSALFVDLRQAMEPESPSHAFIRPEFERQMRDLRPVILDAAKRHNRPELSGMDDREFATVIAQILYNEHFGWLEDAIPPLQIVTPIYQIAQIDMNQATGSDLTVWPSNVRPSVALEMLRHELPVPGATDPIEVPVAVQGTQINPSAFTDQHALYAAINAEISQPALAIEYLAANLERGVYRARYEHIAITWQTLAAWHNQGIVRPADIQANPTVRQYLHRATGYRAAAEKLVAP